MKFTQRLSLCVGLVLIFLILASVTWLLSSFVTWKQTTDDVDELFDTQLVPFTRWLGTLDLNEVNAADHMAQTPNKLRRGHVDDDVLTFAIFTHDDRAVFGDGSNGEDVPYGYQREGSVDGQPVGDKDQWCFVWMALSNGRCRIATGQEWECCEDMVLAIVAGQSVPWSVALPIMLITMMVLSGRKLAPLSKLVLVLRMRDPGSEKPLSTAGVPSEVRPLVEPLNQLPARTRAMMVHERHFTSDTARELRSSSTVLKVQTEITQPSDDDPQARKKTLLQLHYGINRATHLVDQLLALSRPDSLNNLQGVAGVPLEDLLQSSVMDIYHATQQVRIGVRLTLNAHGIKRIGQSLLLGLLIRNLLDSAVRYSPQGNVIDVTLSVNNFIMRDNGPDVTPEVLARIGERSYRSPRQTATDSGLGLSVVRRIAKLHGMNVEFGNTEQDGSEAEISW